MNKSITYLGQQDSDSHYTIPQEALFTSFVALAIMLCSNALQSLFPRYNSYIVYSFFGALYLLIFSIVWMVIKQGILEIKLSKSQWVESLIIILISIIIVAGGLYYFLIQEQTIKTWDSCGYWAKTVDATASCFESLSDSLSTLLSTFSSEYSDLAVYPLIPLGHFWGLEFYQYALYIYFLYAVQVVLLTTLYIVRIYQRTTQKEMKIYHLVVPTIINLLCVPLLHPIQLGYVDVIGLILVLLMLHFTLNWRWDEFHLQKNLILALLSLTLLLCRRWYAFFIVGFYMSFCIECLFLCVMQRKVDIKKISGLFVNLIFIAGICTIWLLLVTPGTLKIFLGNNYSNTYAAYKTRTAFQDLVYFFKDCGFLFVLMAISGLILNKKNIGILIIRWAANFFVTFISFEQIQNAGVHHRYLFIPFILFGIDLFVFSLFEKANKKVGILLNGIVIIASVWNVDMAYLHFLPQIGKERLYTQVYEQPQQRNDLEQIQKVLKYVNQTTNEEHDKVYVVGDSDLISQEVLKRALMPEMTDAAQNVISGSIIDLRDGFPSSAFLGKYVLVASPMQAEHDVGREVIAQLYELFQENQRTEQFYKIVYEESSEEITYRIYEKINPLTKTYIDELRSTLQEYYPDNPYVYEPNYFIALMSLMTSNNYEYYSWAPAIYFSPQYNASINWELSGEFTTLAFDYSNWNNNVYCTVFLNGEEYLQEQLVVGEATFNIDVTGIQKLELVFESVDSNVGRIGLLNGTLY